VGFWNPKYHFLKKKNLTPDSKPPESPEGGSCQFGNKKAFVFLCVFVFVAEKKPHPQPLSWRKRGVIEMIY